MAIASLTNVLAALVGGIVAYQAVATLRAWYRLRHFPGPPLAAVSYLWLARTALSGTTWKIQVATHKKYAGDGHLVRIAPDMLIHSDPAIHRHLNSARSKYVKDAWYQVLRFDPYQHTMFSTVDDAHHDVLSIVGGVDGRLAERGWVSPQEWHGARQGGREARSQRHRPKRLE